MLRICKPDSVATAPQWPQTNADLTLIYAEREIPFRDLPRSFRDLPRSLRSNDTTTIYLGRVSPHGSSGTPLTQNGIVAVSLEEKYEIYTIILSLSLRYILSPQQKDNAILGEGYGLARK